MRRSVNVFLVSARYLQELALANDSVLVFFSGGKDSFACLDLCCKAFKTVIACHWWLVPGLAFVEERLDIARKHYGVTVLQFPHWNLGKLFREGFYCFERSCFDNLPNMTSYDLIEIARKKTGVNLVVSGRKNADSLWVRRQISSHTTATLIYPLKDWNKFDVLVYLKENKLPMDDKFDVNLILPNLYKIHDNYPDDWQKILDWFPLAEAAIWHRKFYGEQLSAWHRKKTT